MRFLSFTVTDNPEHPGFKRLQKSADFWGWDLKVVNQGSWSRENYRAEQLGQLEALRKWDPEYVMYVDAWDTVFTGPPQEVPLHRGVLTFSGDTVGFAPEADPRLGSWYPEVGENQFRFVNAGTFWGDAAKLQSLAGEYLSCPFWVVNQSYFNQRYAFEASVGLPFLRVDHKAETALNLMQVQKRFYAFHEGSKRVEYVPYGTRPVVLHSPGLGLTRPIAPMPREIEDLFGGESE